MTLIRRPTLHRRAFALTLAVAAACRPSGKDPGAVQVVTDDVHRFVETVLPINSGNVDCSKLNAYVLGGTKGLEAYRSKFDVGAAEICVTMQKYPESYRDLDQQLPILDSAGASIRAALAKFRELYPAATFPPVYFVVGNGISEGTTTVGLNPVVLIGVERVRSLRNVAPTVVHELVHTQQEYGWFGMLTGGPSFLRGTLLRHCIKEGSADLIAELVTGVPSGQATNTYGLDNEARLWAELQRDKHDKDYSAWLYNGRSRRLGARPPDIGYFMGYRITKAYYDRASDKAAAIREILTIRDFDKFLAESGYAGGGSPP